MLDLEGKSERGDFDENLKNENEKLIITLVCESWVALGEGISSNEHGADNYLIRQRISDCSIVTLNNVAR